MIIASDGTTVAYWAANIDTMLSDIGIEIPKSIFVNLGVNEQSSLPAEATWKTNYQYCIDAFHTKWSSATIYISKPWKRGYTTEANTMAGWVDDLIAANPGVASAGHDERTWLENGDNGVTMTYDGVHYSAAGIAEIIDQWLTILGY